jgi:uncharacterized membrane protein (Fun14 family)
METSAISPFAATIGGGFFGGVLLGYAIKKIVRIAAIMVGLFIVGLAFLQYQQMCHGLFKLLENMEGFLVE